MSVDIDITELLNDYVDFLEKSGIPKTSAESKLMLQASEEIKKLRSSVDFHIKLAEDNNKSRLRLLDVIENGRELYESTCKNIRESTIGEEVCGMCKYHGYDIAGNVLECAGFHCDDCFELNNQAYNDIIFKRSVKQNEQSI